MAENTNMPSAGVVFKDGLGLLINAARAGGADEGDLQKMLLNAADKMVVTAPEAPQTQPEPETPVDDGTPVFRAVNT